jgi:hypothetical protein
MNNGLATICIPNYYYSPDSTYNNTYDIGASTLSFIMNDAVPNITCPDMPNSITLKYDDPNNGYTTSLPSLFTFNSTSV